MIGNVGFNGGGYNLGQYSGDVENIAKYTLGTTLVAQQENPFDGMLPMIGITGLMEIPAGIKWINDAKKDGGIKKAFTNEIGNIKKNFKSIKDVLSNDGWKNPETYKTLWRNHSIKMTEELIPDGEKLAKLDAKTQKLYERVMEYTIKAKDTKDVEKSAKALKIANRRLAQANAMAHGQIKAPPISEGKDLLGKVGNFFGKAGEFLGKHTGISKLIGNVKNFAVKSPIAANILKFGKGNAAFVAITGGIALFTQVIPAFGLGADKGVAQLGKSTVKTAANIGGWTAGAVIGGAIGSAICPVLGTILGVVVGCLGAWVGDKIANTVVGKDELELAKDEQADKMTKEVQKDPQVVLQLLAAAQERLKSDDPNSEDAKIARQSIEQLTKLAQAQLQQNTENGVQYNPNMNLMA